MPDITIYTTGFCPFCYHAKKLLDSKGVNYDEIDVNKTPGARQEMMQRANGSHTVPQIFIGAEHVGGCDELYALEQQQRLDPLLNPAG
jgi:glutaredoxin 3